MAKVISSSALNLLPEISLSVPIVAAAVSGDNSSSTGSGQFVGIAGGVGLLFGGRDKSAGLKSTPSTTSIP